MPEIAIKNLDDGQHRHSKDQANDTGQFSADDDSQDDEDRVQGNGFSHKGGHDDLGVDLVVDKIKNQDLKRQGRPLQKSNEYGN